MSCCIATMSRDFKSWSKDAHGVLMATGICSDSFRRHIVSALRICLIRYSLSIPPLSIRSHTRSPLYITAVYEAMLPRQPLRFLLADDPGAGKTIMAGLLIKELINGGNPSVVALRHCQFIAPRKAARFPLR